MSITRLPVGDDRWRKSLTRIKGGKLNSRDPGNAALILANDERWAGTLQYEAFAQRLEWAESPPPVEGLTTPLLGEVQDEHIDYVRQWFANEEDGASFGHDAMARAITLAAHQRRVHPLENYFSTLTWDGVVRLPTWLQTYLGAPDIPAVTMPGVWWMISAIARVLQPGCQVDHMLVLEGEQGTGKTAALRILGGPWYLGSLPDLHQRDTAAALAGHWIIEIGELDAFKKADTTKIKNWLSQTSDRFRPSYGRYYVTKPRSCVFAGTTNEDKYGKDATGARRQWPILTTTIDLRGLAAVRDQLWAEALHRYHAGESWWPDPAFAPILKAEQDARHEEDPWETAIDAWLSEQPPGALITTDRILEEAIKLGITTRGKGDQMRVTAILKHRGWHSGRVRIDGCQPRVWVFQPQKS